MGCEQIEGSNQNNVAAVIVTYNRKRKLMDCIEALLAQTVVLDEIIIIDNASTDSTDQMILTKYPSAAYFRLPENIGGAGGYHEGIKLAYEKGYKWIWLMDDDAIPAFDALEQIFLSGLCHNINAWVIASAVLYPDGKIWPIYRGLIDDLNYDYLPVGQENYYREYFNIDAASFMGMLIRRSAITTIGFPEKDYFIDFDDIEYCLRIKKFGGYIFVVPKSKITHNDLGATNPIVQVNYLDWRYFYQNRNKIYTLRKYFRLNFGYFVQLLFSSIKIQAWILLRTRERRAHSTKMLWLSLLDGMRGKLGKNIEFGF